MSTLTIRMDKSLAEELERLAKATHRPKSELARDMLRRQLALAKFERARHRLMPYGEMVGWLTDEDVFRSVS